MARIDLEGKIVSYLKKNDIRNPSEAFDVLARILDTYFALEVKETA